MKRWNIYILLGLLILGACTSEDRIEPEPPNPVPDDDLTTLMLRFPQSSAQTKAFSPAEENRVGDLVILVYTKADLPTASYNLLKDTFAYSIKVPASQIATTTSPGGVAGDTKTAKIKVKNMEKEQRFILLANLPDGLLTSADTATNKSLQDAVNKLTFDGSRLMKDNLIATTDSGFPMWGQMAGTYTHYKFHHSNKPLINTIEINMIRAVARIDVGLNINGMKDPALGFGSITAIDSVYLCKANSSGTIMPHEKYLLTADSAAKSKVYLPNPVTTAKKAFAKYTFRSVETDNMVRTIYAPESDILDSPSGNKPAFLIIKAQYYGQPTYYRIDFTNDGKYIPLIRNHSYQINIIGARAAGFSTWGEAFDSEPTINNPNVIFNVDGSEINEIITNEQYYLGFSAKEIKVDWNHHIRIPVFTDYPGGWKATSADVTLTNSSGNGNLLSTVTANLTQNTTGTPKEYTIRLSAGTLSQDIKVIQIEGSNSYMLKRSSASSIQIPIKSARVPIPASIKDELEIWTDWTGAPGTFTISGDILTYTPPSGVTGNVVIGLMQDGGPGMVGGIAGDRLIWSWHVWVTSDDPEATQRSNNGYIFMDRNLGTSTANMGGLFYQWGRKDPFAPGHFTISNVSGTNNLGMSIASPSVFYTTNTTPFDWIGTAQNNNLWTKIDGDKGDYDPCPFGWRVPIDQAWEGFTGSSKNGITLSAAGYLDLSTGDLINNGYAVWGASSRGTSAYLFNGNDSQTFRANGYPVRCVRDVKR